MPQAIAAALFTAGTFGYAVTYALATVAINYGLSRLASSLAGKPKRDRMGAERDVTVRGTVEPMQLLYGELRTPGFIAYFGTSGDQNKYLHFVVVWAAHQCEAIYDLWLDATRIPVQEKTNGAGGGVGTGAFVESSVSRLFVYDKLGTKNQTVDTVLDAAFTEWDSNCRGAGLCYTHFRLEYSEYAFPDGAPQNFYALIRGRRLYDPRKDSTNGGSGAHRYNDATTWEWSQNWALAVRDYITGGSRWYDVATPEPRLGFGEPNTRIADSYVIAAANISDENVTIPDGAGGSTTQKRYTCDVQLSCSDTYKENLELLKTAGVGNVTYVNGRYRIYAGAYDTPTVTITEDDILGPMDVSTHPRGESVYNMVSGTFFDENRDWQPSTFPSITNSSYETDDGGQKVRRVELPATRSSYRAQRIGILLLAQSRQKITARFTQLSPKAMRIAQWETFYVTIAEYGWSQKVFRCLEWEWDPATGWPAITAREESSSAYADPAVGTYATPQQATVATPEYDEPNAPINFTVTSRVQGVLLQWQAPTPRKSDQIYHVYQHTANSPFSSATRVYSGKAFRTEIELAAGTTRYYWVTSELNGMESAAVPAGNGTAGTPGTAGTADLANNAVTSTAVTTEPADGSQFYAAATQPVIESVGLNGLASYTSPAGVATQVDVSWTAQARISNTTSGTAVGQARLRARVFVNSVEVYASHLILEPFTGGSDHWGAFSGTRSFAVPAGQTIDAYIQTDRNFSTGGASPSQTMYWRNALVNLVPSKR